MSETTNFYYHFPIVLDNTQITAFQGCPVKWFYKHCLHLQGELSVHLHFGGAYAKGLEVARYAFYKKGKNDHEALALGLEAIREFWGDPSLFHDDTKNLSSCLTLLELYFMQFPMHDDTYMPILLEDAEGNKSSAVEFEFIEPLDIRHPDFDTELFFTGRADMVTSSPLYPKNSVLVFDDKTMGGYITPFSRTKWQVRGQFTGYAWGLRKKGFDARGAVISLASITRSKMEFERIETPRSVFQIQNWERNMLSTVKAMKKYYQKMVKLHKKAPKTTVPGLSPITAINDECNAFFRNCWYTEACSTVGGESIRFQGASQHVWLPHEQRRAPLESYLTDLIGDDKERFVWKDGVITEDILQF